MARPKVGAWYREGRDAWYGYIGGKAVSLGVKGKANRLEAQEAYFRLTGGSNAGDNSEQEPGETPHGRCVVGGNAIPVSSGVPKPSVRELVGKFMTDAELRSLAPLTIRNYSNDLKRFCETFGNVVVGDIRSDELLRWFRSRKVADSTRKITMASVSAFFGWCVRAGHIEHNTMKRVPRPRTRSRAESAVITPDEHTKLLKAASPWMRNVLIVLHATGCRPGEVCRMSVENFFPAQQLVKLTEHKTANKTDKPRLIFLPPAVVELFTELAKEIGSGALLRTKYGKPWSPRRITERMQRLKKQTGVKRFAYGYRHTFVTDALSKGTPEAVTAALVGHSSTVMIHKFYSHLTGSTAVLAKAVNGIRG